MQINNLLSDEAILSELGERISLRRLALNMTQAELARSAGMAKRTLERIEGGASTQVLSLIKILRVLDHMDGLNHLIPESGPRPMDLLKHTRKKRVRASRRKKVKKAAAGEWKWKEDE